MIFRKNLKKWKISTFVEIHMTDLSSNLKTSFSFDYRAIWTFLVSETHKWKKIYFTILKIAYFDYLPGSESMNLDESDVVWPSMEVVSHTRLQLILIVSIVTTEFSSRVIGRELRGQLGEPYAKFLLKSQFCV